MEGEYAVSEERQMGSGRGWRLVLLTVAVCLGACQPEQPIAQRVTAFWEARIQGDEATAYQYEIYAHTGEMTVTQYIHARSPLVKYLAYTIEAIQEEEKEAQVTVSLQYQVTVPGMLDLPLSMDIQERWVRSDNNQWYRDVQPTRLSATEAQQS